MNRLLTLDKLLRIDKYTLTNSQRNDCVTLANHFGCDRAIEQAEKFHAANTEKQQQAEMSI